MAIIHNGPFVLKFVHHVQSTDRSSGCWEWQGTISTTTGYGTIGHKNQRTLLAHRLSYELHWGEVPDGLCVLHRCDNRKCVNPDHLFLGTKADNVRDMTQKGRNVTLKGEQSLKAKLTEDEVRAIRLMKASGRKNTDLARQYGVSESTIIDIAKRKSWKHLD